MVVLVAVEEAVAVASVAQEILKVEVQVLVVEDQVVTNKELVVDVDYRL